MKRLLLLSALLLVVCCSPRNEQQIPEQVLDSNVLSDAVELTTARYFDTDSIYNALYYMVYRDSVLVVKTRQKSESTWLEFYNIHSGQLISRLVNKGNGPDEAILLDVDLTGDDLVIYDVQKNRMAHLDMNLIATDPNYKSPELIPYIKDGLNAVSPTVMNHDSLLFINPYYFKDEKTGVDNKEPLFLKTSCPASIPFKRGKWDAVNVNQGFVIANEEKNRVLYASGSEDLIVIADCNGKELLHLVGPGNTGAEFYYDKSSEVENRIIFWKDIPASYTSAVYGDDCFYLTYCGKKWSTEDELYGFESWIFKFDCDGHVQKSYHINRYIDNITLSSLCPETFYATGYDSDGIPEVLKLTAAQ